MTRQFDCQAIFLTRCIVVCARQPSTVAKSTTANQQVKVVSVPKSDTTRNDGHAGHRQRWGVHSLVLLGQLQATFHTANSQSKYLHQAQRYVCPLRLLKHGVAQSLQNDPRGFYACVCVCVCVYH